MLISTRGRYALRVMIDLAEHQNSGFIPMKEVAQRQGLSLKYVEQILPALTKNNLIQGLQGKGGGYRLNRKPDEYLVGEILRLTDGDLVPVSCLHCNTEECDRADECKTHSMWQKFYDMTNSYFDGITISDLIHDKYK